MLQMVSICAEGTFLPPPMSNKACLRMLLEDGVSFDEVGGCQWEARRGGQHIGGGLISPITVGPPHLVLTGRHWHKMLS